VGVRDDREPVGVSGALDLVVIDEVAVDEFQFSGRQPLSIVALFEGSPGRSPLSAVAGSDEVSARVILARGAESESEARSALAAAVSGREIQGVETKELLRSLCRTGEEPPRVVMDLALAEYLIDPGSRSLTLDALVERYLGLELDADEEGQQSLFEGSTQVTIEDLRRRLSAIVTLGPVLRTQLHDRELTDLFDNVELPLVRVLAKMEIAGIAVDRSGLEAINLELRTEVASLLAEIWREVGSEINPNSTQQLAHVLFDQLGLTPSKRTKTGFSTDAQTLERLRGEHRVVELVLKYRELDKLRSTFAEGLLGEIASDGRIHATFHQTVARTGRISSDRPNLHNIPIRTETGRRFREVFVAPPGRTLVVADYSQIELRVIAHLSQDDNLCSALVSGRDLHVQTAAQVFSVPESEVTATQRSRAKMVAYGLAYGMESYGLAQRLAISTAEADEILTAFFQAFPGVRRYMDAAIDEAKSKGYTRTLFGRRRYFTDLHSSNRALRQAAERQAMNAGIQGLAADIFKMALVELDRRLIGLDALIVLQVHDEVLVECASEITAMVEGIVEEALSQAASLSVPLVVEAHHGSSWALAK
jgi:DNA polymerase-1